MGEKKFVKVFEDNTVEIVDWDESLPFYKAAQEVIGDNCGCFEPVGMVKNFKTKDNKSIEMMCDGEGRLSEKDVNPTGSYLYGYEDHGEPICGNIIFGKMIDTEEGRDIDGLTESEAADLSAKLHKLIDTTISKRVYENKPIPPVQVISFNTAEEMKDYFKN